MNTLSSASGAQATMYICPPCPPCVCPPCPEIPSCSPIPAAGSPSAIVSFLLSASSEGRLGCWCGWPSCFHWPRCFNGTGTESPLLTWWSPSSPPASWPRWSSLSPPLVTPWASSLASVPPPSALPPGLPSPVSSPQPSPWPSLLPRVASVVL